MNKTIIFLIVAMLFAVASPAFAETYSKVGGVAYRTVKGEIVSLKTDSGSFTVKDEDSGKMVTFKAFKNALSALKAGDQVNITTEQGSIFASQIVNLGQAIEIAKRDCACPHSK